MSESTFKVTPRSLRQSLSLDQLSDDGLVDDVMALGSYWSRPDDTDLQSRLVKYFKEAYPRPSEKPRLPAIVHAYSEMLCQSAKDLKAKAIVRVLASGETRHESTRPQSMLVNQISQALSLTDYTHLFYRTEPRKPMRMVHQLAGNDMLRQRLGYVLQDLFIFPQEIGGTVLVIDDIYNLGATARVYAGALKRFCEVKKVYSLNIAAARFHGGKDGWGYLSLDVDSFAKHAQSVESSDSFDLAWIGKGSAEYHLKHDCLQLQSGHKTLLFLARENRVPCPSCAVVADPKRNIRNWLFGR